MHKKQIRLFKPIFLATLVFAIGGCASKGATKAEHDGLKLEVMSLSAEVRSLSNEIDDLNARFSLLQEKTSENSDAIGKFENKEEIREAALGEPPKNLKTIKLTSKKRKARKVKSKSITGLSDKELYERGQDFYLSQNYKEARDNFHELSQRFEKSTLADNALYWMAESYYSEQDYVNALKFFEKIVNNYSDENKGPDAMLKLGFTYFELEEYDNAKATLERVIVEYPDTGLSQQARKKLKELEAI